LLISEAAGGRLGDERTNRLIAIVAIDNLVKGVAGQAVQNLDILLDVDETTGLQTRPLFP